MVDFSTDPARVELIINSLAPSEYPRYLAAADIKRDAVERVLAAASAQAGTSSTRSDAGPG